MVNAIRCNSVVRSTRVLLRLVGGHIRAQGQAWRKSLKSRRGPEDRAIARMIQRRRQYCLAIARRARSHPEARAEIEEVVIK